MKYLLFKLKMFFIKRKKRGPGRIVQVKGLKPWFILLLICFAVNAKGQSRFPLYTYDSAGGHVTIEVQDMKYIERFYGDADYWRCYVALKKMGVPDSLGEVNYWRNRALKAEDELSKSYRRIDYGTWGKADTTKLQLIEEGDTIRLDTIPCTMLVCDTSEWTMAHTVNDHDISDVPKGFAFWIRGYEVTQSCPATEMTLRTFPPPPSCISHLGYLAYNKKPLRKSIIVWQKIQ